MSKIKKTKKYVSHEEGLSERLKDPEYASLYLNALLEDHSKDAEQFFTLLKTDTFKGSPSFFSWYGRVNVAYQLLHKIKDQFDNHNEQRLIQISSW